LVVIRTQAKDVRGPLTGAGENETSGREKEGKKKKNQTPGTEGVVFEVNKSTFPGESKGGQNRKILGGLPFTKPEGAK